MAIFAAFFLTLFISRFSNNAVTQLLVESRSTPLLLAGTAVTFSIGFFDDFKRMGPKVKFAFQIPGTSLSFWGGARTAVFWGVDLMNCAV